MFWGPGIDFWKSSKPEGAGDIYLENWPLKHEWLRKVGVGLGGSTLEPLDTEYGFVSRSEHGYRAWSGFLMLN